MTVAFPKRRAALIVAHPGHELRVYGWLSLVRPLVFVLTDGSGHGGQSRLSATGRLLEQIGIEPGSIYGRLSDVEIYSAIINQDLDLFIDLSQELAEALLKNRIDYVVGDAIEGYNPAHDICRLVVNTAVEIVKQTTADQIENFDFLLTGKLADHSDDELFGALHLDLDEDMASRKLKAAREYSQLTAEVNRTIEEEGINCLESECLRHVQATDSRGWLRGRPYYEHYGEQQVAAGHYKEVIRYREHFIPIAEALLKYSESRDQLVNCAS